MGPRQVGKTVLLRQVVDYLLTTKLRVETGRIPAGNITYFDFSDDRLTETLSPRAIQELTPPGHDPSLPRYFILDEITRAANWAQWLKGSVDRARELSPTEQPRFLVTDSAAALIKGADRESGYGRWREHRIDGLSFSEYLGMRAERDESPRDVLTRDAGAVERYLELGGLPAHATRNIDERDDIFRDIREDTIERALLRELIRSNVEPIRPQRLLVYLCQQSGNSHKLGKVAKHLEAKMETVEKWMQILCDARLLVQLNASLESKRSQRSILTAHPRFYAVDHGFVGAFTPSRKPLESPDTRGRIMETAVFRHLREFVEEPSDHIAFFRKNDDLEYDFRLELRGRSWAIEVKSDWKPRSEALGQMRNAMAVEPADRAMLIYGGIAWEKVDDVLLVPLHEFLLDPRAALERTEPT